MMDDHARRSRSEVQIRDALIDYVYENSLTLEGGKESVPVDVSLIQAGLLDSFGIIEMVAFIEKTWKIVITEEDFTVERMGSIHKMARLIARKIQP
jgi:acyl carrier protein